MAERRGGVGGMGQPLNLVPPYGRADQTQISTWWLSTIPWYTARSPVAPLSPAALDCRGIGCPVMNDCSKEPNQTDDGDLLSAEVSDEVIEAASMVRGGFPTLWYGTYCFGCPSRPARGRQVAHEGRGAADRGEYCQAAGAAAEVWTGVVQL